MFDGGARCDPPPSVPVARPLRPSTAFDRLRRVQGSLAFGLKKENANRDRYGRPRYPFIPWMYAFYGPPST